MPKPRPHNGCFQTEETDEQAHSSEWQVLQQLSDGISILYRYNNNQCELAPLVIKRVPLMEKSPESMTQGEKFLYRHPDVRKLTTTGEKLQFYRHKNGLSRSLAAQKIGICYSSYKNIENNASFCPVSKLRQLADVYKVNVADLYDDYYWFLAKQGEYVKAFRKGLCMTQGALARELDVDPHTVRCWEWEYSRLTKPTYQKLQRMGFRISEVGFTATRKGFENG